MAAACGVVSLCREPAAPLSGVSAVVVDFRGGTVGTPESFYERTGETERM
jgi:hypothetical protein